MEALRYGGGFGTQGAKRLLLRSAVAALLNSTQLNYPLTEHEVISITNIALHSNSRFVMFTVRFVFDFFNNHGRCPLFHDHDDDED
jgi:hypothetical protein